MRAYETLAVKLETNDLKGTTWLHCLRFLPLAAFLERFFLLPDEEERDRHPLSTREREIRDYPMFWGFFFHYAGFIRNGISKRVFLDF